MEKLINDGADSLSCINDNKYIIGITMIMLNIGARFIIDELDDDLRNIVSNTFVRRVVFIFCSFFMATKDLFTAIILTIIFVIFINEVFAKELDSLSDEKNEDKGASFNKIEIEKTIQQLKTVQLNM